MCVTPGCYNTAVLSEERGAQCCSNECAVKHARWVGHQPVVTHVPVTKVLLSFQTHLHKMDLTTKSQQNMKHDCTFMCIIFLNHNFAFLKYCIYTCHPCLYT